MLEKNKLREFNLKELTLLHNLEKNLLTADSVDIYIDTTCCDENKLCKAIKDMGYNITQDKSKFDCNHIYIVSI